MSVVNCSAMLSVAKRQIESYAANPVGYLFIFVYVVATMGYLLFIQDDAFRIRNVADLDLLHVFMPWTLVIFLPILGMGSWASEKEHGTEELLLTMPVSAIDAVSGKFIAISMFFTVSLGVNALSAIGVLSWLGEPDIGLLLANYVGWWLLGLALAACSLFASTLVASQTIAFVLAVLFSSVVTAIALPLGYLNPFERGIIPIGGILLTLVLVAGGIALALLRLASRRWRPGAAATISVQVVTTLLALGVTVNLARIGDRYGVDMDVTADGLSSVSAEALAVLNDVETPVELIVAVTDADRLPAKLQLRAKELIDMSLALERARPDLVKLTLLRPEDRLDDAGSQAMEIHGIFPQPTNDRTVMGNEQVDAFLGAAVRSSGENAVIPYFFQGLSVEYELVRAIRSVSQQAAPQQIPEVTLRIAIGENLPDNYDDQREQIIRKLVAIADSDNSLIDAAEIRVSEFNSKDPQWLVVQSLGLSTHTVQSGALDETAIVDESAVKKEELLFAAYAKSGDVERRVQWLGDEADAGERLDDLIVDVRARVAVSKPVVGILETELRINGGFHPVRGEIPRWEIVNEWSQQYEIRTVRSEQLNDPDFLGVDALVVPLPSALPEAGLQNLYDYIHDGNPTMLLFDSMPFNQIVSGQFIAPVEPPEAAPPQMRMPTPPPKGNIEFFVRGLGLEWDKGEVLWSRYNPSVALRQLGPHFIWLNAERGSVAEDHPITSGIDSLMTIYSSLFTKAVEHEEGLQIFPLLAPNPDVEWGVHHYNDLILRDPYPRLAEVGRDVMLQPTRDRFEPMIAAEIRGTPKHIYDERNAESEGAEKAEQEGDVEEAAQAPIHVVAIADTDLASSIFFQFYRDIDGSVSASDNAILASLRNVQFMSNALIPSRVTRLWSACAVAALLIAPSREWKRFMKSPSVNGYSAPGNRQ